MTTHQKLDTEMYADSAEWCPFQDHHTTLLCGTYQLQENSETPEDDTKNIQVRLGHLQVYTLNNTETDRPQLKLCHKISMPGILDIKWCRTVQDGSMVFGIVNSVGQLQIWKYDSLETEPNPHHTLQLSEEEKCLGLSLDWSSEDSNHKVVASDSTGAISLYDVHKECQLLNHWKAHDFEAWICCFNQWNTNIIYTGGDDCKLKGWDTRLGTDQPFFSKRFDMGVCSMQCNMVNTENQNLIAVGGYDEHIRIWDVRNWKRPLSELNVGGGVWRIKWDPFKGTHILTATMYNGFHIVDASSPDGELVILKQYTDEDHGSLGYGADWCYANSLVSQDTSQPLIATCSFYDHSLHLWSFEIK